MLTRTKTTINKQSQTLISLLYIMQLSMFSSSCKKARVMASVVVIVSACMWVWPVREIAVLLDHEQIVLKSNKEVQSAFNSDPGGSVV